MRNITGKICMMDISLEAYFVFGILEVGEDEEEDLDNRDYWVIVADTKHLDKIRDAFSKEIEISVTCREINFPFYFNEKEWKADMMLLPL